MKAKAEPPPPTYRGHDGLLGSLDILDHRPHQETKCGAGRGKDRQDGEEQEVLSHGGLEADEEDDGGAQEGRVGSVEDDAAGESREEERPQ